MPHENLALSKPARATAMREKFPSWPLSFEQVWLVRLCPGSPALYYIRNSNCLDVAVPSLYLIDVVQMTLHGDTETFALIDSTSKACIRKQALVVPKFVIWRRCDAFGDARRNAAWRKAVPELLEDPRSMEAARPRQVTVKKLLGLFEKTYEKNPDGYSADIRVGRRIGPVRWQTDLRTNTETLTIGRLFQRSTILTQNGTVGQITTTLFGVSREGRKERPAADNLKAHPYQIGDAPSRTGSFRPSGAPSLDVRFFQTDLTDETGSEHSHTRSASVDPSDALPAPRRSLRSDLTDESSSELDDARTRFSPEDAIPADSRRSHHPDARNSSPCPSSSLEPKQADPRLGVVPVRTGRQPVWPRRDPALGVTPLVSHTPRILDPRPRGPRDL